MLEPSLYRRRMHTVLDVSCRVRLSSLKDSILPSPPCVCLCVCLSVCGAATAAGASLSAELPLQARLISLRGEGNALYPVLCSLLLRF